MEVTLPGYVVEKELARNARSVVYAAVQKKAKTPVVLKCVQNDGQGMQERDIMTQLAATHLDGTKNVVRLLDTCDDGSDLWLVLERFDGTADQLDPAQMTPMALMTIAYGAAKGLREMWCAGVVDDDVKPANLAFKTGSGRVVHIDLGYARMSGDWPLGSTPPFGAPELATGPSDTSPCYGWARSMELIAFGRVGMGPDYTLDQLAPWVGRRFAALVASCCHPDPGARPSVEQLCQTTKAIVSQRERCPCSGAIRFHDGACVNCGG